MVSSGVKVEIIPRVYRWMYPSDVCNGKTVKERTGELRTGCFSTLKILQSSPSIFFATLFFHSFRFALLLKMISPSYVLTTSFLALLFSVRYVSQGLQIWPCSVRWNSSSKIIFQRNRVQQLLFAITFGNNDHQTFSREI